MEGEQVLTESDLAKYPFTAEAAKYVKGLDLKIEDLASIDFKFILDRAESRIEEALLYAMVSGELRNIEVEIPSFPIAVMMVAAAGDTSLKSRYALAEAKRAYDLLKEESKEKTMEIADNFNWRIRPAEDTKNYDFALHFADFLRNAADFHDLKWKLVNRALLNGEVYLTKEEAARLIEEEVRRHIEGKLDTKVGGLPENIMSRVERLRQISVEKRGEKRFEELPKGVVVAAFPPCIKSLYEAASSGRRLSHIGRFALTSFLVNIGMNVNDVVDLFRSFPDFNERLTRYQVEHIAGERGSRTKYIPPTCSTLRTHGVCSSMEEACKKVRHPLAYYRRKLWAMRTEAPKEQT